jgi:DNA-3-methyladenine glycosylase
VTALGRQLARSSLAGDAVQLAPTLLGRVIVSDTPEGRVAVRLTEVEAYRGADDPASHAYRGTTARNLPMFGEPGHLYTYFVYGMHWCANVVAGRAGQPSAVLLRAGEVVIGHELAASRRSDRTKVEHLARGPAGLASVLGLAADQNGMDLCVPGSTISIRSGARLPAESVQIGPRVGVNVGVEQPWRFSEAGAPSVSIFRPGVRRHRNRPTS